MDHGQRGKCNFLVCWSVGLLAVVACVIQCLMDMQFFLFVCLVDGWMDGWMDRWMDGCCVNKGGRGCGGGRSANGMGGFDCLACWLLGWFVGLAALLLGWLVGWLALR